MAPSSTHSLSSRIASSECPWLPIWVWTLYRARRLGDASAPRRWCGTAAFGSRRACPACMAAIAMTACVWSGVAMMTASMFLLLVEHDAVVLVELGLRVAREGLCRVDAVHVAQRSRCSRLARLQVGGAHPADAHRRDVQLVAGRVAPRTRLGTMAAESAASADVEAILLRDTVLIASSAIGEPPTVQERSNPILPRICGQGGGSPTTRSPDTASQCHHEARLHRFLPPCDSRHRGRAPLPARTSPMAGNPDT